MPLRIEIPNSCQPLHGATAGSGTSTPPDPNISNTQPPNIGFKHSVLSLLQNVLVATDQGQALVNDIYTQFINMIRLEVENNIGWLWSEGSQLGMGYDTVNPLPSWTTTQYPNINNAMGSQSGTAYEAMQGIMYKNCNGSPITNDLNEFGPVKKGVFTISTLAWTIATDSFVPIVGGPAFPAEAFTGFGITSINGTAVTQATVSGATANNFYGAGSIPVYFPDGETALVPYTTWAHAANTQTYVTSINGTPLFSLATGGAVDTAASFPLNNYVGDPSSRVSIGQIPFQTTVLGSPTMQVLTTLTTLNINGAGAVAITNGAVFVGAQTGARNPCHNKGFLDRVTVFQAAANYQFLAAPTATTGGQTNTLGYHIFGYTAIIPLRLIHDFFYQLDVTIINLGFNMQFFLAQPNGPQGAAATQYPPFMTSNNAQLINSNQTFAAVTGPPPLGPGGPDNFQFYDTTPNPVIYYGASIGTAGSGCRLYYRSVKFSPADNEIMAKKLTEGYTKTISYISTNYIIRPSGVAVPATTLAQVQDSLGQSVVHPLRAWELGYPNNSNLSASMFSVGNTTGTLVGQFISSSFYAPGVVLAFYTNVNILLNSVPYFRQNFQNPEDLWEQLKEQFNPDTGSMIRYSDWRNYKRIICLDLTRIADRLQSPTEPVSLQFQANRNDNLPTSMDTYYLLERKDMVTMRFAASDVTIVAGNLD